MATVQLNCRIDQQLANRLKQAATERQQTLGTLVAQGIELLLAAPSSQAPDQLALASTELADQLADQLAALAKRLEALEAERPAAKPASPKRGDLSRFAKAGDNQHTPKKEGLDIVQTSVNGGGGNSAAYLAAPPEQQAAAPQEGAAITTAELAKLTETNRPAWNNWAAKATPGETRHHPEAGSWQLVGKAVADAGGPARWLWKQS